MTRLRSFLLPSLFLGILVGCRPVQSPPATPTRLQWPVMGTVAAIQGADTETSARARAIIQPLFERIDAECSAWKATSALSAVNRAAGTGEAIPVPSELADLLRFSIEICRESDGAFNPLIGPVMRAWGFNGAASRPAPPDPTERQAAEALADWRALGLPSTSNHQPSASISLPTSGMLLDLGGVAKGYAVDQAWSCLTAAGLTNVLIDLGGNLRAIGEAAPGRGGWRTGVRNPFAPGTLIGSFLLRDGEAVATSGNYERFVTIAGVRYAHIMDGRTGIPVTGMAGVTVVAPTAQAADALSTTLFILGPEKGLLLLARHPGCDALWIPDEPGSPTAYATPSLASRLTLSEQAGFTLKTIR